MSKKILRELNRLACSEWEVTRAMEILKTVKKCIGGTGKIYAKVDSVSSSGMSRKVSLYIVHKGEIVGLNNTAFSYVYGDRVKNGEVTIQGCGMDMLFECTYRLYQFLFNQKKKTIPKKPS